MAEWVCNPHGTRVVQEDEPKFDCAEADRSPCTWERVPTAARKPRVSYTNRARLALLLTPIWLPLTLLWWVACSFGAAASEWWDTFRYGLSDTCRLLYREVYRPARHGSVFDAD